MTYRYSDIDNNNIKWFTKDESKATLLSIEMLIGEIRGLKDVKIEFKYPITAIAGRNGSGKTTILALWSYPALVDSVEGSPQSS